MTTRRLFLSLIALHFNFNTIAQSSLLIQKAIDFSYREQWDSAIACYNSMAIKNNTFYFDRGMCHHLSTDFKKSNSDFFMYTKMHPLEADGWLLLAESSLYIENYRLTKKAVRHFIKMEPKNSAAYFIEACACFYTNRSNKARKLFVKSILYDPEFTLSNLYLSIGLLKGHSGPDKIDALDSLILNEFTLHPPRNNFEGSIMNWHINHLRTFYQSYLE